MTLYEFNLLDLNERIEAVNKLATFLDNHATKSERCNLYALDRFFVEVVYNPTTNKITDAHSFKTGYLLDKYSSYFK
jgi:hypothetical protein